MAKLAVIINGRPGAGKDALCDAVIRSRPARKISSIDPFAEMARLGGWDGVKDAASRRLLSELKRLFAEYNDWPNRYVLQAYRDFLRSGDEVLFIHVREPDQIDALKKEITGPCVTLLIRRPGLDGLIGNNSDDRVYDYAYDRIYNNKKPLRDSEEDFCILTEHLLLHYA